MGRETIEAVCECGRKRMIFPDSLEKNRNKNGEYLCVSCSIKKTLMSESTRAKILKHNRGLNSTTRGKISSSLKRTYSSPEKREEARNLSCKVWAKPGFRERQESVFRREDVRSKLRDRSLEASKKPGARERKSSDSKKVWEREAYREKQMMFKRSDDHRKRQSLETRERWKNTQYREATSRGLSEAFKRGEDTYIERAAQKILDSLSVEYVRHHSIGWYEFDIFVPQHRLLIECQGEYWHSLEKAKARDASKYSYINNNFPDHKILYLYERDFLNLLTIRKKIEERITGSELEIGKIEYELQELTVSILSNDKMGKKKYNSWETFLQSFHYAGAGRSAKIVYGATHGDQIVAVCKFSPVIRAEVATSMGLRPKHVLELDRLCVNPIYRKKNLISWFLSRCVKETLGKFEGVRKLVSFADTTFGHDGTSYRAANWKEEKRTKPDYHYVNSDGYAIHKKTLYNHAVKMRKKEIEYASEFGFRKVFGKEKIKFVYDRKR